LVKLITKSKLIQNHICKTLTQTHNQHPTYSYEFGFPTIRVSKSCVWCRMDN